MIRTIARAGAERTKEQRVERLSRHSARIVLELRREGNHEGAARFEAVAIEAVELVRRGAL